MLAQTLACYRCLGHDHFIRDCPKQLTPITRGPFSTNNDHGRNNNNNNNQGGIKRNTPRPPTTGRVFVMRHEEANEDDNVITSTLSIHSSPAHVLFDYGASHSFISPLFAKCSNLKPCCDFHAMSVALPSGEIVKCRSMYRNCPIIIEKIEFLADLIAFDLSEFNIILGTNWLIKYKANLNCSKQSVTLKTPIGDRISFQKLVRKPIIQIVSALKARKIAESDFSGYLL
ncbi:uncharacterized protein [Spinacia oleracea]|uniref:CCHC-type domain-containing protein n=1 Tax=Spinacia oleracea TaxID=3562 RepID=A0ABM3RSS5_SPIOL|nr:uncharacterized protein LOC130472193 [Spinacia oleracea]